MPDDNELSLPFITRKQLDFEQGVQFQLILQLIAPSPTPIEVRGYTKDGQFKYSINPVGAGNIETFTLGLNDIPVSVSVQPSISAEDEAFAHATLNLAIDGDRMVLLAQGIITTISGIAWPHVPQLTNPQADGLIISRDVDAPAAGAGFDIVVPDNEVWELLNVSFNLVASADAANRIPKIAFDDGSIGTLVRVSGTAITANQTVRVNCVPGGTTAVVVATSVHEIGLPQRIFLQGSNSISVTVASIDDTDEINGIRATFRLNFKVPNV